MQLNLSSLFFAFPLGAAQQGCEAGSAQAGIPQDQDCVPRRLEAGGEPGLPRVRAEESPCKLLKVWL